MARDFVFDQETQKVKVVVTTHQDIERELLTEALSTVETQRADLIARKLEEFNATLEQDEEVVTATKAVAEAKSELEGYDEVAVANGGLDSGSEGSSSEAESGEGLVEAEPVAAVF